MQSNDKNSSLSRRARTLLSEMKDNNDLFSVVSKERFIQEIAKKAGVKSYYEKNINAYLFTFGLSFFFNAASAATCYYFFKKFFEGFISLPVLATLFSVTVLIVIEIVKRYSSSKMWDSYFFEQKLSKGWAASCLVLLLFSIVTSNIGGSKYVADNSGKPEIAAIDSLSLVGAVVFDQTAKSVEGAQKSTWKGRRTGEGMALERDALSVQKEALAMIKEGKSSTEKKQEELNAEHQDGINERQLYTLFLVLVIELFFEVCMWRVHRFEYKCLLENKDEQGVSVPVEASIQMPPILFQNPFNKLASQYESMLAAQQQIMLAGTSDNTPTASLDTSGESKDENTSATPKKKKKKRKKDKKESVPMAAKGSFLGSLQRGKVFKGKKAKEAQEIEKKTEQENPTEKHDNESKNLVACGFFDCKSNFKPKNNRQKYCSTRCRNKSKYMKKASSK